MTAVPSNYDSSRYAYGAYSYEQTQPQQPQGGVQGTPGTQQIPMDAFTYNNLYNNPSLGGVPGMLYTQISPVTAGLSDPAWLQAVTLNQGWGVAGPPSATGAASPGGPSQWANMSATDIATNPNYFRLSDDGQREAMYYFLVKISNDEVGDSRGTDDMNDPIFSKEDIQHAVDYARAKGNDRLANLLQSEIIDQWDSLPKDANGFVTEQTFQAKANELTAAAQGTQTVPAGTVPGTTVPPTTLV